MSRVYPSDADAIALGVPCPFCEAAAGDWCITSGHDFSTYLHSGRTTPIREAWSLGYEESEHYIVKALREESPWVDRIVARHNCSLCSAVTP